MLDYWIIPINLTAMKWTKFSLCLLILAGICSATAAQSKKFRVFIIGNSFSQNATTYLQPLAQEGGYELQTGRAELGGCSLERHWRTVEAAAKDSTDPEGKPYGGKSLKQLLSDGKWDIVTIQQYSLLSGDSATYRPYAKLLCNFIKSIQPEAKIYIHQIWAYRVDAKEFGKIKGETRAKSATEMHRHVRAAYRQVAKELNLGIIPVGDAFRVMSTDHKWGFKPGKGNDKLNSLHVGHMITKDNVPVFDPNHASAAGCYLGSLVWYRTLLGGDVRKVSFRPAEVSAEMAEKMKKVVAAL